MCINEFGSGSGSTARTGAQAHRRAARRRGHIWPARGRAGGARAVRGPRGDPGERETALSRGGRGERETALSRAVCPPGRGGIINQYCAARLPTQPYRRRASGVTDHSDSLISQTVYV